jgi:peptidoglycan/xylan/chitin deacetylase (PgdA/CDA1 family)
MNRPTIRALAMAVGLTLLISVAVAIPVFESTGARLALMLAAWSALAILLAYLFVPSFDWPGRQLSRVPGDRAVALTIDDGPNAETTPAILDALRAARVKATFFLVGAGVVRNPDLARRIVDEGHAIGNHTMRHRLLPFRTAQQLTGEIDDCQYALSMLRGRVRWFRPPNGFKPIGLHRILARRGLTLVGWQGAIRDTDGPCAREIVDRALALAAEGRILLLHDNPSCRGQTAIALPAIIDGYRSRGYRFVFLDGKVSDYGGR